VALYLGLLRPPEVMKGLLERFRLEPLKVHEVSAAPATRALNSFCPIDFHDPREGPLPDCELELGWYRVRR